MEAAWIRGLYFCVDKVKQQLPLITPSKQSSVPGNHKAPPFMLEVNSPPLYFSKFAKPRGFTTPLKRLTPRHPSDASLLRSLNVPLRFQCHFDQTLTVKMRNVFFTAITTSEEAGRP